MVDPLNDLDMWTLQEYAATNNYWGTWWASVSPLSSSSPAPTPTPTASATPAASATATATATATPTATATMTPTPTPAPLSITTSSLPSGKVGVSYSATVQANGGKSPYSFALTSGSIPPGLALASGGSVSGTPSASGKFNFKLKVTDSAGASASKNYQVKISP